MRALRRRLDRADHTARRGELDTYTHTLAAALGAATGAPEAAVAEALASFRPAHDASVTHSVPGEWAASETLLCLSYALVKLIRPARVVETGTASGHLASAILAALSENGGDGHLHSFEMPPFGASDASYAGAVIPTVLRARWTLHVGPSLLILPEALAGFSKIDLFIHDSDHSYWYQRDEYELALSFLRPGGVLVSDDVENDAFLEVAERHRLPPRFVSQLPKARPVGLLVRTS